MDDVFSTFTFGPGQLPLGTGPGAITYNDNAFLASRRNIGNLHPHLIQSPPNNMGHFNNAYQFGQQNKREQRHQQNNQMSNQVQTPAQTAASGTRELPPRFLKQLQQQQQQLQQQTPSVPNSVQNPAPVQLTSLTNHHSIDGSGISLRPAQNSIVVKPNIPLSKTSLNANNANSSNVSKNFESPSVFKGNKTNKNVPVIQTEVTNNTKNTTNQTNKEVIIEKAESALNEFISENKNIDDVIAKLKELKIPKK